jgi:hypothetical protein
MPVTPLDTVWEAALGTHTISTGQTLKKTLFEYSPLITQAGTKDVMTTHRPSMTPLVAACHDSSWPTSRGLRLSESKNRGVVEQVTQSECLSHRTTLSEFIAIEDT